MAKSKKPTKKSSSSCDKTTSPPLASKAAKTLRSKTANPLQKSYAGSLVSQSGGKCKPKKPKKPK